MADNTQTMYLPITADTYISTIKTGDTHGLEDYIEISRYEGGTNRALLFCDISGVDWDVIEIVSVALGMTFETRRDETTDLMQFTVHSLMDPWIEDEVNWATQPRIRSTVEAEMWVDYTTGVAVQITDLFKKWVDGTITNYGFAIISKDEHADPWGLIVKSRHFEGGEPIIEIHYNVKERPAAPNDPASPYRKSRRVQRISIGGSTV